MFIHCSEAARPAGGEAAAAAGRRRCSLQARQWIDIVVLGVGAAVRGRASPLVGGARGRARVCSAADLAAQIPLNGPLNGPAPAEAAAGVCFAAAVPAGDSRRGHVPRARWRRRLGVTVVDVLFTVAVPAEGARRGHDPRSRRRRRCKRSKFFSGKV